MNGNNPRPVRASRKKLLRTREENAARLDRLAENGWISLTKLTENCWRVRSHVRPEKYVIEGRTKDVRYDIYLSTGTILRNGKKLERQGVEYMLHLMGIDTGVLR